MIDETNEPIDHTEPVGIEIIEDDVQEEAPVVNEEETFSTDDIKENPDEDDYSREEVEYFNRLFPPSCTLEDVLDKISQMSERLGQDKFVKEWNKVGTFLNALNVLKDTYSDETEFVRSCFEHINPGTCGDSFVSDDGSVVLKNMLPVVKKKKKEVSGRKAKLLIMASKKKIRKVFLYNSGFYIILRTPTLDELYVLYSRLSDTSNEYGSQFGMLFYMFADFFFKEIFCEFIMDLIEDSNLINFSRGDTFLEALSIHDFNTILLNIGIMLFKEGYPFTHVCTSCETTLDETIDLNGLQQTDFSRLTEDHIAILTKAKVSASEVSNYKNMFNFTGVARVDGFNFFTSVPSMKKFLSFGKQYHNDLTNAVTDIRNKNAIANYVKYSFNRVFAPWIDKVEVEEDGEVTLSSRDNDSIIVALNMLTESSNSSDLIKEKLEKFMKITMVTLIGYRMEACPECGEKYSGTVNGFVPFDIQKSVFTMLAMKLIQVS